MVEPSFLALFIGFKGADLIEVSVDFPGNLRPADFGLPFKIDIGSMWSIFFLEFPEIKFLNF